MMKDAELDEIEARAAACFVGPWRAETWQVKCPGEACPEEMCSDPEDGPCGDDHTLETVTAPEEYPRDPEAPQVVAQVDESGIQTPGLGRFARAHAVFIAHARTDVPALVAEVRRLRAVNERAALKLDEWSASAAQRARLAQSEDERGRNERRRLLSSGLARELRSTGPEEIA